MRFNVPSWLTRLQLDHYRHLFLQFKDVEVPKYQWNCYLKNWYVYHFYGVFYSFFSTFLRIYWLWMKVTSRNWASPTGPTALPSYPVWSSSEPNTNRKVAIQFNSIQSKLIKLFQLDSIQSKLIKLFQLDSIQSKLIKLIQ